MSAPAEAIAQEVVWKNAELKQFCVTLVVRALKAGPEFTTDIVPDDVRGDGPGMAGSAATILQDASVIQPVGHYAGKDWYPKKARSTRPASRGRYLNVYRLTSPALAVEFLKRHGHAVNGGADGMPNFGLVRPVQSDLFSEPVNYPK